MRPLLQSKIFWVSSFLVVLGLVFIYLENTLYQFVDENGVLHESLFMPLGALSILFGGAGLVFVGAKLLRALIKRLSSR